MARMDIRELRRRMDDLAAAVENLENDHRPHKMVAAIKQLADNQKEIVNVIDDCDKDDAAKA